MASISTILGAILFLRFGYAVGNVGFFGAIAIIILGHAVTIPTALAVAEIATNRKVEGGGDYYVISRSFGLNIGAAIGIALFLSQAISVSFYIIAFTESFIPFGQYLNEMYNLGLLGDFLEARNHRINLNVSFIHSYNFKRSGFRSKSTVCCCLSYLYFSTIIFFGESQIRMGTN